MDIEQLQNAYKEYGYNLEQSLPKALAFSFTKGLYNGVDIVSEDKNCDDAKKLQEEFQGLGYAVRFREYKSNEEVEEELFTSFFSTSDVVRGLTRKYESFQKKILKTLPENAVYSYVQCPYELYAYDEHSILEKPQVGSSIINFICKEMLESQGPVLIVLEAAAGYGKTCTAYEILNELIKKETKKLPFFTELSKDRNATIFKHILQMEIENQFSNKVDTKLVVKEIEKGRVPLIIDGFDELISKDFSFSCSQFESVENMLSTIVDLLRNNAKILITSRKTAIFNSEEFHNYMMNRGVSYRLLNVILQEPKIDEWLDKEKIKLIEKTNFPLSQAANPVLLSYLRYSSQEDLLNMNENQSIVDKYFDFLLKREQIRQNLLMEPAEQIEVFKNYTFYLTSFGAYSLEKSFAKDIIMDDECGILDPSRLRYNPEDRPRKDQLADRLSNHAFLDKKNDKNIGFVNDFIFGTLIGLNLVKGLYKARNEKFYEELNQSMAVLAAEAFRAQSEEHQQSLWDVFNSYDFGFDPQFMFKIDVELKKVISHKFENATIGDFVVKNIKIKDSDCFESVTFTNTEFYDCSFDMRAFHKTSFINCSFNNCIVECGSNERDACLFYNCVNSSIFEDVEKNEEDDSGIVEYSEDLILEMYFKTDRTPRHRQISSIRRELADKLSFKEISRIIHKLKVQDFIQQNGDMSFVTRKGINYFNTKVYGG